MENDKVRIVGRQLLDFPNRETGEKIQGLNLFVLVLDENVVGMKAVKQFIPLTSPVYSKLLQLDLEMDYVDCIFKYSYKPGQSEPVLVDIEEF